MFFVLFFSEDLDFLDFILVAELWMKNAMIHLSWENEILKYEVFIFGYKTFEIC